ncbi:MAG TPA: gas vesicle protein GvpG [Longimicrobiales bacterium]
MGLIKHLLFWPVTGPKFLIDFSLRKVEGIVREELTDVDAVKAELMELQLRLEVGDIDDEEYVRREQLLMERLREIREWREEFGMGVSGGPVRVAPAENEAAEPTEANSGESSTDTEAGPPVARPGDATIDLHLDWE